MRSSCRSPSTCRTRSTGRSGTPFDATEITNTAVPPNTTMTINYRNGNRVGAPCSTRTATPCRCTATRCSRCRSLEDEQDDILGLQFVFTADDGSSFPPGTTVEPHFSVEKRTTERDTTTVTTPPADIENCGTTSASAPAPQSTPTDASSDCSSIHVDPYDPDGDGPDVLDKDLTPQTIVSRSQSQATGHPHWSTGGLSGVEQVVIQDESTSPRMCRRRSRSRSSTRSTSSGSRRSRLR